MGSKDTPAAPAPPDPYKTAAAQTQGDVQSAIANSALGNVDTYTPLGSNTYQQIGTQTITDAQGNPIQVPRYSSTQTLSPQQQQLYDQQTQLGSGLNQLAIDQTSKLSGLLGSPIDTSSVPAIQTSLGAAPSFKGPATAQTLQTSFNQGGPIQSSVNQSMSPTTFAQGPGSIQTSMGPTDFTTDRQAVVDALNSRTQPALDRQLEQLKSSLANQGIDNGSQAWNNAIDAYGRQANDANQQNVLAGSQEQSRLFGLDLSQAQFGNAAQQQGYDQAQGRGLFGLQATAQNNAAGLNAGNFANSAQAQQYGQNANTAAFANSNTQQNYTNQQAAIDAANQLAQQSYGNQQTGATFNNQAAAQALQQQLALRNQPINEITALMGGGQVTMPQFAGYNAPQIAGSSVGANINQNAALANSQYQQQMQMAGINQAGLYSLGAAGLGAVGSAVGGKVSDRRLKREIEPIGELRGLPLYSYKYIWSDEPQIGFMADEVEKVMPEAVGNVGGYKTVDYGMVLQ